MGQKLRKPLFWASVSVSALTLALPAYAQDAGTSEADEDRGSVSADRDRSDVEDVIIVTSRRREERLQDIPESVTAFSAAQIERRGIRNVRDVADLTPNFSQLDNFRPGLARLQVRGVITPQVGDPPVAFVVDGVTASDLEFINQELFDIERIEVLRGAQGALYGRGAIGGAINIVTKKPSDKLEGRLSVSAANGEEYRASGVVSGAIAPEKVYFRVGGYYRDFGGVIDDTFLNQEVDFVEETSVFGKLIFDLSDQTGVDVRGRYTTTDAGLGYYQGVTADTIEDFSIETRHNVPGLDEREIFEINARLEHELSFATLEVVGGYSSSDQEAFSDSDFSTVPSDFVFHFAGAQENILEVNSWTVESRLTSTGEGRFRWALGGFYQDRTRDSVFNSYDDLVGNVRQDRSDFDASLIVFSILDDNTSEAWALSAQANYDITDRLELTAALRYDSDDRSSVDTRDAAATAVDATFEELQPKASLAYQMTDDVLLYGGYSRGFRSGGFNEFSPTIQRVFDEELSDSFELGIKSTLLGGAVTLNAAAFLIDQTDAQITRFNVDSFTLENISVDDARSQGFEVEISARPTSQLTLNLNGGIIDSEINEFDERPDVIGDPLPFVSEYNVTGSVEYQVPVANDADLFLQADVRHVGPRRFSFDIPDVESSARTFVDFRAVLESKAWTAAIYTDNAFDERQAEDLFLLGDGVTDIARFPNQGQRYGIEITHKF